MFGVDLRSLAVFRIGMALVLLGDLLIRATDLKAFYTDNGVLPRAALLAKNPYPWTLSLHLWNGTPLFQALLFLLTACCALGLLVGYRTQWMTCLCWFLTASLHARNFLICQGGDDYLKMSLFWSMFLPLGARFSIDSALTFSREKVPTRLLSCASFALVAQTIILYISTATFKSRGGDWWEGTALYYVLNLDCFARGTAFLLLLFPGLLRYMTYAVLAYEFLGPFLLISPIWNGPLRTFGVFGFLLLHLGIMSSMAIGPFQWVSMAAITAFLPSWFWERVVVWKPPIPKSVQKILYDLRFRLPIRPLKIYPARSSWLFVLFFLVCVIWWDLSVLFPERCRLPATVEAVCHMTNITQSWAMFSPDITKTSGWFVIPGKLKNGSVVDLYHDGGPVRWAPPPLISSYFKNERWRKYLMNMRSKRMLAYRRDFSLYLCRNWNQSHGGDQTLGSLQVVFVGRHILPNYRTTAYERTTLWQAYCSPEGKVMGLPLPSLAIVQRADQPVDTSRKTIRKHRILMSPYAP